MLDKAACERRAVRKHPGAQGEPVEAPARHLAAPRAAARAGLAGAGPAPDRAVARDRPPVRGVDQPARRDRARHRRRRAAADAPRHRPRPRRTGPPARPAPRAHAPERRAAHPRRPHRPGAAPPRRGGGHRRPRGRTARQGLRRDALALQSVGRALPAVRGGVGLRARLRSAGAGGGAGAGDGARRAGARGRRPGAGHPHRRAPRQQGRRRPVAQRTPGIGSHRQRAGARQGAAEPARPGPAHAGRRGEAAGYFNPLDGAGRGHARLRPESHALAGAAHLGSDGAEDPRPDAADPRYLRPARTERGRQAAGRIGAAQVPAAAAGRQGRLPLAAGRRHRRPRARRDQA